MISKVNTIIKNLRLHVLFFVVFFIGSCQNSPDKIQTINPKGCSELELGYQVFQICSPDVDLIDEDRLELKQFILRIKDTRYNNGPLSTLSANNYSKITDYYSFQFKKDIWLKTSKGSITPVIVNFVSHFNSSPFIEFSILFDISDYDSKTDFILEINDVIFNNGLIKFAVNY